MCAEPQTRTIRSPLAACAVVPVTVALALVGGCGMSGRIGGGDVTGPQGEHSAAFLDRLADAPTVSESDAATGVLMLLEDESGGTFEARVRRLRDRDVLPQWNMDAGRPLTRGRLAYMVYQATDMPGGLTLTLTGPSRRYCLREMQHRGMVTDGLASTPVTGMEFVAVLTRAERYARTGEFPDNPGRLYADRGPTAP
ncbi:MAG: hypothetical protein ACOC7R_04395 [Planctomycetota bacterium]